MRGLLDAWVSGESQIVVRASHNQAVALITDFSTFVLLKGDEIGVVTSFDGFSGSGKCGTLGKEIHETPFSRLVAAGYTYYTAPCPVQYSN
jgi:hypothetical protein